MTVKLLRAVRQRAVAVETVEVVRVVRFTLREVALQVCCSFGVTKSYNTVTPTIMILVLQ